MTTKKLQKLKEDVWKIMGWTPWTEEEYPHRDGWSRLNGEGEKRLECDMDDPTTDAAAAIKVLEKCSLECHEIMFAFNGMYSFHGARKGKMKATYGENAKTVTLAICLFAKKLFAK